MSIEQKSESDLLIIRGSERREIRSPGGLGSCPALEAQLAALEQKLQRLQSIHPEPDWDDYQRRRHAQLLHETQAAILQATLELQDCRADLTVVGVELTQCTQFFLINGQGSGAEANNSVPLIAYHPIALRVYVNSKSAQHPGPRSLNPISGRVIVERIGAESSSQVAILNPINRPIRARSASFIDRGNPNHTLNFHLSAADSHGLLSFTVQVFEQGPVVAQVVADLSPYAAETEVPGPSRAPEFFISGLCEKMPALRIRAVLIHYTGNGQNLSAPTAADFMKDCEFMTKTYPIGQLVITDFIEQEFNRDLSLPSITGDDCGPGWAALLELLRNMSDGSDDKDIYVGLVPRLTITEYGGCGNLDTGVAAAIDGSGDILAQEVGHALHRRHAPSGGAKKTDPCYPAYDSYPAGSIGEFGFDPWTSKVYDPSVYVDFMGYGIRWVSPYTFIAIRSEIIARFGPAAPAMIAAAVRHETLHLRFRLHRDGTIEVRPSFHLPSLAKIDPDPLADIACELLAQDGEVLTFYRCHLRFPEQDAAGPYVDFWESLPWFDQATSIRFLKGKDVLHVHIIEKASPDVDLKGATFTYDREPVVLTWKVRPQQKAASEFTYMVRHSSDGGRTWRVVASELRQPSYRLDPRQLPGGKECCLQVVASAGIRTSVAKGELFSSPLKPRIAYLLSPDPMANFPEGSAVLFRGMAFSADFGLGDIADAIWTSNLDGPIGRGLELVSQGLSNGTHLVTLTAPDGFGGVATESLSIRIGEPA